MNASASDKYHSNNNMTEMQGIMASATDQAVPSTPQKSIFSSLMTQLPAANNDEQMQGITQSNTNNPTLSTPQKSFFSSLMTQLPAADKTQMQQFTFSAPSTPTAPRRRGPMTKRPVPRDRPSSFDLDAMVDTFAAGPGAEQAMEEEEHAFRHAKAYADANADQMKTTLAFSSMNMSNSQHEPNSPSEKQQKQKYNPFYQRNWTLNQAIEQLQQCLVACSTQSQN